MENVKRELIGVVVSDKADKTITVSTKMLDIEGIELEFSIIRETALDGETGRALKNPECKNIRDFLFVKIHDPFSLAFTLPPE